MELVNQALSAYGASLNSDGFIQKGAKVFSVQATIKGQRLRLETATQLLASGPITAKTVESFVEKFWYWKKAT